MPSSHYVQGPVIVQGKPVLKRTRDRTWSNTANYWTTDRGSLPINSYDDVQVNLSQTLGKMDSTSKSSGVTTTTYVGYSTEDALLGKHQTLSNWIAADEPSDAILLNQALVDCLTKVADAKVNLPVLFAEASKTSDLILGSANRIYRAYGAFRRGHFGDVAKILDISPRRVHKTWLEYKYGWMPTLMDVKGSAEFFAQQHVGRPVSFSVSATKRITRTKTETVYETGWPSGSHYTNNAISMKAMKVKMRLQVTNPHLSALQQLGLTNPALVAWELVPFSFVFDWFISVGDWLQALTALHGVTVLTAMSSRLRTVACGYNSVANPYESTSERNSGYNFMFQSTGRSYTRGSLSVDPSSIYPPRRESPFTGTRLLTSLALLRAQGRRLDGLRV